VLSEKDLFWFYIATALAFGLEPQRASPFKKWVKAPPGYSEKPPDQAGTMIHLFVLPFTLMVVLAHLATSSTSGDL
jgi:hypothetical protein